MSVSQSLITRWWTIKAAWVLINKYSLVLPDIYQASIVIITDQLFSDTIFRQL